jgi:polysaccharide biosynthesis protein PslG
LLTKDRKAGWVALCAAVAACATVTLTAPAAASADPVWGVVPQDGALPSPEDLQLMADGGVESIRLMATWGTVEPARGARDWETLDTLVRETTSRGIQPLLFLYGTPQWVGFEEDLKCAHVGCAATPPRSKSTLKAFARFAKAAVQRYGPGGEFWEPPEDPALGAEAPCGCTVASPIRVWQVWNEQNSRKYFKPKVRVGRYAKLVKAAGKAIKSVDPEAEVMLGGMWGPQSLKEGKKKPSVATYVDYMKRLYRVRGIKRWFDSLAIHPYSANLRGLMIQLQEVRKVARKFRDRKVGLWITELGWASDGPGNEPYVKGAAGQAEMLGKAYGLLERKRRALGLRGVFWYSWRDQPEGRFLCDWCVHSGLRNPDGSPKPAWDTFVGIASG